MTFYHSTKPQSSIIIIKTSKLQNWTKSPINMTIFNVQLIKHLLRSDLIFDTVLGELLCGLGVRYESKTSD